jgi:hypothetical protein
MKMDSGEWLLFPEKVGYTLESPDGWVSVWCETAQVADAMFERYAGKRLKTTVGKKPSQRRTAR